MSAQASTEEIAVVVKHTFIDVSMPSMAQDSLRRSSVPAGMWLCPSGMDEAEMCGVSDVSTNSATGCTWASQGDDEEEEEVGTASQEVMREHRDTCDGYGDDQELDIAFQEVTREHRNTCDGYEEEEVLEIPTRDQPSREVSREHLDTCAACGNLMGVKGCAACDGATTPCSSPDSKRTALRSTAKAWQPLQAGMQAWQSQRFDKQVADIKAKVEVAMLCSGYDADISIEKESNGYTVSVRMAAEDAEQNGDDLLAEAQQTLLTASEQSTCVCVLGYGNRPFQPLKKGFIATLAEMQDEASACWDMYAWGSCPYGRACNRQHPRSVAYIVVQLVA